MDNCDWMGNTSPLVCGQQIYGFHHGEVEYQASGRNSYLSSHIIENCGSSKKSRSDGGDFRHGPNGLWRTVAGESSQLLSNPRLGRQNCTGWMQNQRAVLCGSSCNVPETWDTSDRINMDHEGNLGRISKHGFAGLSNTIDPGPRSAGFDFFHTGPTICTSRISPRFSITGNGCARILPIAGATFMKDTTNSWNGATGWYSSGINLRDGTSTAACHADGPSLKEEYSREMFIHSSGYGMGSSMMMDFQNIEMQGSNRNSLPVVPSLVRQRFNQGCGNGGGNCDLEANFLIQSSFLPVSDGGRTISSICGILNNSEDMSGGRVTACNSGLRGSCKRKRFVAGSEESLPFPVPPSPGRMGIKFSRPLCADGPRRFGASSPNCASSPNYTASLSSADLSHHTTATPFIHENHYPRNVLDCNRIENVLEFLRGNTGNTIPFIETHRSSPRTVSSRLYSFQPEQSSSQFHVSFAQHMRRPLATSQFHTWFSRQAKQPLETVVAGTGDSVSMHEGDFCPSSVLSQRNGNSFGGSIWGGGNLFSRDNVYNGVFGTSKEMAPGLYGVNQIQNISIDAPCWPRAMTAGSRMSVFDSASHFTSAVTNGAGSSQSLSQLSQDMSVLDPSLTFGGVDVHDQHSDMRLDVDNMSYEELLALGERIGNVSTGLTDDAIAKCLRTRKYSSLDVTVAMVSQESEVKCSICQEEYVDNDELGRLDCDHSHHTACIKQWLVQKNQCPICKAVAYSKS
eukprot:c28183_g1_i3 orf=130-2346(+)